MVHVCYDVLKWPFSEEECSSRGMSDVWDLPGDVRKKRNNSLTGSKWIPVSTVFSDVRGRRERRDHGDARSDPVSLHCHYTRWRPTPGFPFLWGQKKGGKDEDLTPTLLGLSTGTPPSVVGLLLSGYFMFLGWRLLSSLASRCSHLYVNDWYSGILKTTDYTGDCLFVDFPIYGSTFNIDT